MPRGATPSPIACSAAPRFLRVLSQSSIFGQNPKIWCQKFNDLQTPKCSKKQLCDRTRSVRSCVGAWSWVSGLIAGRLLLPLRDLGEGDHLRRSLTVEPFPIAFRNELWEGKLPGLLPMVGEPAKFLRVQPQLARHLDVQIAQVKAFLGLCPRVEAGFGLLHDVSFCGQPAAWTGPEQSRGASPGDLCGSMPQRPAARRYGPGFARPRPLARAWWQHQRSAGAARP
jgi:hypothetical protein